jgi:hypothetical protein
MGDIYLTRLTIVIHFHAGRASTHKKQSSRS